MTDEQLEELELLQQETTERHSEYLVALQERDARIRELIASGVSMYQLANKLQLSESAVRVIRDR